MQNKASEILNNQLQPGNLMLNCMCSNEFLKKIQENNDDKEIMDEFKNALTNPLFQPNAYELAHFILKKNNSLELVSLLLASSLCTLDHLEAIIEICEFYPSLSNYEIWKLCLSHEFFPADDLLDMTMEAVRATVYTKQKVSEIIYLISLCVKQILDIPTDMLGAMTQAVAESYSRGIEDGVLNRTLLSICKHPCYEFSIKGVAAELFGEPILKENPFQLAAERNLPEVFNLFYFNENISSEIKKTALAIADDKYLGFKENLIYFKTKEILPEIINNKWQIFIMLNLTISKEFPKELTQYIIFLWIEKVKNEVWQIFDEQINPKHQCNSLQIAPKIQNINQSEIEILEITIARITLYLKEEDHWKIVNGDFNRAKSYLEILKNPNVSSEFQLFTLYVLLAGKNMKDLTKTLLLYISFAHVENFVNNYVRSKAQNFSLLQENLLTLIKGKKINDIAIDLATASEAEFMNMMRQVNENSYKR